MRRCSSSVAGCGRGRGEDADMLRLCRIFLANGVSCCKESIILLPVLLAVEPTFDLAFSNRLLPAVAR